ncbi:MAG: hypothetical protein K2I00_02185 [Ruminococcus sp.]|nr:hypothetical protein [Ruminococcus sp.]
MTRRENLIKYLCRNKDDRQLLESLIDEFLFLENQLAELRKLPFIKIHPSNPEIQKSTPASKQYKELLQQYTNIIKILERLNGDDSESEESPLRIWLKNQNHADKRT